MTYTTLELIAETKTGHVSNVKLFDYLDQARKDWYHFCILYGVEAVIVHTSVDYKKEVFHNTKLSIRTSLEKVGNSSFTIKQTMVNDQGVLVVAAEVVLAVINRQTREKTIVPDEVRVLLYKDSLLDFQKSNSSTC